jgi:hypothetical protein
MATVNAIKGIKTEFLGDADVITCTFSPAAKKGIQIEAEGFTLNNATITAKGISSDDGDIVTAEAKHVVVIGTDIYIREVSISGVAAGTYNVTFIDL